MEKEFDLIGIGECLIELSEDAPKMYNQSFAGDVFNTLFYAARLGLETGFISHFGQDKLTKGIWKIMDRERIDRSCTSRSEKKNNGLYLISTDKDGEPTYTFWREDSAARYILKSLDQKKIVDYILSAEYFHSSAIALAVMGDYEKFISILKKVHGNTITTFDSNYRKNLWKDIHKLVTFLELAAPLIDVLFVSASDDFHIFGNRSAHAAMDYYKLLGYKTVIFRQGADEVLASEDNMVLHIPPVQNVTIVDTTAAGDAFNAGFIAARIEGKILTDAVRRGNECAAFVISRKGGLAQDFKK